MRPTIVGAAAVFLLLASLAAAEPLYHVVEKGETIYSMARTFKISSEALLKANGISDPTKVRVGQRLLIPQLHVVKKGDTLYGIARLYGVDPADLAKANSLSPQAALKVDQTLVLPTQAPGGKTAQAPGGDTGQGSKTAGAGVPGKAGGAASPAKGTPASPGSKAPASDPPKTPAESPKTPAKAVLPSLLLPCAGEARYLEGKVSGILILSAKGVAAKAVVGGLVVSAGPFRGYGLVVFVKAPNGLIYAYGGNDSLSVTVGASVTQGQEVGKVGYDAREGRPAAYFWVFRDGKALDPASIGKK